VPSNPSRGGSGFSMLASSQWKKSELPIHMIPAMTWNQRMKRENQSIRAGSTRRRYSPTGIAASPPMEPTVSPISTWSWPSTPPSVPCQKMSPSKPKLTSWPSP
jgi:hypothetical protein